MLPLELRVLIPLTVVTLLAGCKPAEPPSAVKVIVGAVLFDGTGGPPMSDSVVTIEGAVIRAVGTSETIPIPTLSEKINGAGKFLVPGLVDIDATAGPDCLRVGITTAGRPERAGTPDEVGKLAVQHVPVFAEASSLADCRNLVGRGATGFFHMIRDTEAIDPVFVANLRDLQVVFAPELMKESGAAAEVARRNTRRLANGGVPIAVGADPQAFGRELEQLAAAGMSPPEILQAATRNGALALRRQTEVGAIEPGMRADLLLLSANPGVDIRNLQRIDRVMAGGDWQER